jgi:hypothetical protein
MSKSARTALLVVAMIVAVLLAPFYLGHVFGGIAAAFVVLGIAAFLILAAAGVIVISAAGILALFLAICVVLLVALSPVLVPVALLAGFIWLIMKIARRSSAPPAPPAAPPAIA